jgi:glycosyltransferase involved in cell wall biosynthesis
LESTGARVVSLQPNRGKGFALLRGFQEALGINGIQYVGVVDADGQHDPVELPRLFETAAKENADLLIGSRSFAKAEVPWRSRFGNTLTASITKLLFHRAIGDTQSGYRIHSRRLVEHLVETIPGGRYETEMAILVAALRGDFNVTTAPIQTIYETDNASSHFNKFRDSFRIYRVLLLAWLRSSNK